MRQVPLTCQYSFLFSCRTGGYGYEDQAYAMRRSIRSSKPPKMVGIGHQQTLNRGTISNIPNREHWRPEPKEEDLFVSPTEFTDCEPDAGGGVLGCTDGGGVFGISEAGIGWDGYATFTG